MIYPLYTLVKPIQAPETTPETISHKVLSLGGVVDTFSSVLKGEVMTQSKTELSRMHFYKLSSASNICC